MMAPVVRRSGRIWDIATVSLTSHEIDEVCWTSCGDGSPNSANRHVAMVPHRSGGDTTFERHLCRRAGSNKVPNQLEVFIGHSSTTRQSDRRGELLERTEGCRCGSFVEVRGFDDVGSRDSSARLSERQMDRVGQERCRDVRRSSAHIETFDRHPCRRHDQVERLDTIATEPVASGLNDEPGQQALHDDAGGEVIVVGDGHESAEEAIRLAPTGPLCGIDEPPKVVEGDARRRQIPRTSTDE